MTIRFLLAFALFFCGLAVHAQSFDTLRLVQTDTLYFDFGKADIRPAGASLLDSLTAKCQQATNWRIRIEAHTDSIGNLIANQTLSEKRVNSVQSALTDRGLSADRFLTFALGESAPASSNASETGRQRNRRAIISLYQPIPYHEMTGYITHPETGQGLQATIRLHGKGWADTTDTDTTGRFSALVPTGSIVGVDVFAPGYLYKTEYIKALPRPIKPLTIQPAPLTPGTQLDLANFYFVGNKDILLPRSEPELIKLLHSLRMNPGVRIEIAGHINYPNRPDVSKDSWNYELSVKRAKRIYDYLIEHGLSPERISYQGYGNWEMRYPKARSEKLQALNRRVEIKVLE